MMTKGKSRSSSSSSSCEDGGELRRGPWTLDEDNLLIHYITTHGEGRWNTLAKFSGLKRTGKSCRLRWLNYLKPDIKRGNLTPHEQLLILELHSRWGNRWSKIAQNLPGRTDNEIKNYWRTRVQKQARQLKIDSNSKKFVETIRMFWMPRLLEKMEQDSSIASSPTSSISTMEIQKFTAPSPVLNRVPVPSVPSQNPTIMVNNVDNNFLAQSSEISGYFPSYGPPDYHVEVPGYNMQEIETPDKCGLSRSHMAELDWFGEDMGEVFWNNSEEVWELMNQGVCLDRR